MKERQTCDPNTRAGVGMHKNSQIMSKAKPSIRIIHIYAPQIIKTDVANFRQLVQRLTGKPAVVDQTKLRKSRNDSPTRELQTSSTDLSNHNYKPMMITKKMEYVRASFERIKEEEEEEEEEIMWGTTTDHQNSAGGGGGGGFLGGFADLEYGFMQELGGGFPLLPFDASHMDAFGETTDQLASC
ncbi:VQ motif-containing protein 25-like [Cornus florida]|uniref:VQ motif-containing protein 25-like n=1 Tax=Cornus florida TaxID=4283 RepID=UPI00289E8E4B|nr:VQ motif-containing protein 25-like [Cornus florida]